MIEHVGIIFESGGRIVGIIEASLDLLEYYEKQKEYDHFLIYDRSKINKDLVDKYDPYLLAENSENEISIEKCFVNLRNEIDFKTKYSALKYTETVIVGNDINISGIPNKASVTWPDGFQEIIDDGFLETTATLEGEYKFVIDHSYYFPIEVIINATP